MYWNSWNLTYMFQCPGSTVHPLSWSRQNIRYRLCLNCIFLYALPVRKLINSTRSRSLIIDVNEHFIDLSSRSLLLCERRAIILSANTTLIKRTRFTVEMLTSGLIENLNNFTSKRFLIWCIRHQTPNILLAGSC